MTIPEHLMEKVEDVAKDWAKWYQRLPFDCGYENGFKVGASFGYQLAMDEHKKLLDDVEHLLTQIQSQMCWERDRDQLTMGFTDLHTPVTEVIVKLKAQRGEE